MKKSSAQTTLIYLISNPNQLVNKGYCHNTRGLMILNTNDPVNNLIKSNILFQEVNNICKLYLTDLYEKYPSNK